MLSSDGCHGEGERGRNGRGDKLSNTPSIAIAKLCTAQGQLQRSGPAVWRLNQNVERRRESDAK